MRARLRSILVVAIILVLVLALIIVGYRYDWTGFNGNNKSGKTRWDWLQLLGVLAIPIVVDFGTAFFTRQQAKTSEANAENQQQEELLRTYFDKISELVLNSELSTNGNVESIVRARTLAALHILNATRKGIVIQFLHDLNLLQHVKSYFYLLDLRNTQLIRINLHKADLYKANLYKTDLREADLGEADLGEADLRGTDLSGADLNGADLSGANLNGARYNMNMMPEKEKRGKIVTDKDEKPMMITPTLWPEGYNESQLRKLGAICVDCKEL